MEDLHHFLSTIYGTIATNIHAAIFCRIPFIKDKYISVSIIAIPKKGIM